MIRRLYTLVFVRDVANKKILLGYKKRGFGMNKWNGLGGKVESNETIEEGAIRESKEESGLIINQVKKAGIIEFQFEHKLNETLECHLFCADSFSGEACESEEIAPKWFNYDDVPFEKMWKDDKIWFPKMLEDKTFKAYFLFKEDQETIVNYTLEEVDCL